MVFMIWQAMYGSGCKTGTVRIITNGMLGMLSETREGQITEHLASFAAAPGAMIRGSSAWPPATGSCLAAAATALVFGVPNSQFSEF